MRILLQRVLCYETLHDAAPSSRVLWSKIVYCQVRRLTSADDLFLESVSCREAPSCCSSVAMTIQCCFAFSQNPSGCLQRLPCLCILGVVYPRSPATAAKAGPLCMNAYMNLCLRRVADFKLASQLLHRACWCIVRTRCFDQWLGPPHAFLMPVGRNVDK